MTFNQDIEQVFASESYLIVLEGNVRDPTHKWEEIHLPYPAHLDRRKSMYNLAMIKSMLTQMELRNGVDYIFCRPERDMDQRTNVRLRFKTPGEGLIATMRWLASDWYRKQS